MKTKNNVLVFCAFLVVSVVLNITTTSLGDESSRLTITNKTNSYLHVFVDGTPYAYVAPDRAVTHVSSAHETFYVEAYYSPGQGKANVSVDSTFTLPYTPATSYSTGDNCSCEDPNSSISCSDDEGVVTNPAQGGSANWELTDDLFEEN